ncbi:cyanate permease [Leucobacter exalbidus]|uniref:Cyanate permease n=1 Tax=Leucobacter exalbidus TaxID=662960 RepID=A0A940PU62_9MICO|nr:hypothetical protein [Leucobacter exalbidus]MBP1327529.1 cyanate permease [Leucobacter exalbidus]
MTRRIISWVVGAAITGLYLYMVIAAAGNLILLPQMVGSMGLSMTAAGWFWLITVLALAPVAFVLALLAARRKSAAVRLLALATGLCVAGAVQLEILLLVPQSSFFG